MAGEGLDYLKSVRFPERWLSPCADRRPLVYVVDGDDHNDPRWVSVVAEIAVCLCPPRRNMQLRSLRIRGSDCGGESILRLSQR